jgi:iron complex transport system permease protein
LCTGIGVLLALGLLSLALGSATISPQTVWAALVEFDGSAEHIIIRSLRIPRAFIAVAVGVALAVSGSLMQGLTRNPLASPGILGVNAGAALAVVASVYLLPALSVAMQPWFAFAGAAVAAAAVYGLGSLGQGRGTAVALVIAGAAITALLTSLTTAILIFDQQTLDRLRFWLAGSVAGGDLDTLLGVAPYLAAGLVLALVLAPSVSVLSLGDEVAAGLGQSVLTVRLFAALAVVLLSGGAVAIAGPIGFVGLVVPHVARALVGHDYRWLLPYAGVLGGLLMLVADVAARLVIRPSELPVGVMTALLGGPFFVYVARKLRY